MMTTQEAAKELGVSRQRVLQLIKAQRLAFQRFGKRGILIDRRALEAVRVRVKGRPKINSK